MNYENDYNAKVEVVRIDKYNSMIFVSNLAGDKLGEIKVSKSAGRALQYVETTKGLKNKEFMALLEQAKSSRPKNKPKPKKAINKNYTGAKRGRKKGSFNRKPGLTFYIRKVVEQHGWIRPKEILEKLNEMKVPYKDARAYSLIWIERKRQGYPSVRPRKSK